MSLQYIIYYYWKAYSLTLAGVAMLLTPNTTFLVNRAYYLETFVLD